MLSLGSLAFATPWALAALLTLPVLWWLLRITPPTPKLVEFPPLRLLLMLRQKEETPAHTPLWLLILRLLIAALVIFALTGPVLNPQTAQRSDAPLILVIDDGWKATPAGATGCYGPTTSCSKPNAKDARPCWSQLQCQPMVRRCSRGN